MTDTGGRGPAAPRGLHAQSDISPQIDRLQPAVLVCLDQKRMSGWRRPREGRSVAVWTYSTMEANWEVKLVTAEAVHGIGFASEPELELEATAEQPAGSAEDLSEAAD